MITLHYIKKTLFLIWSLLFILITSCESIVEIDNPNNQIGTEEVYKDLQTTKAALSHIYSSFRSNSIYSGSSTGLGTILSLYTDELESTATNLSLGYHELYNNTISDNLAIINNTWLSSYQNIYTINAFIEGVNKSPTINTIDKIKLTAQAKFVRILYYQTLTQLYGDIPYITSTDYRDNTTIAKTKHDIVLKNIESELLEIIDNFEYTYVTNDRIYPNLASVELALAKNYLLRKDFTQAEFYAKKIIGNPLYELEAANSTFKKTAKSTLWQVSSNFPTDETLEAQNFIIRASPNYILSKNLLNVFSQNDIRKQEYISTANVNNVEYYYSNKYKSLTPNTDELSIIFRIEEVYFILVEALAYQDKISPAVSYLNKIRQKAGIGKLPTNLSRSELINHMLTESLKEFFCESGQRFFSLKRNNKLSYLSTIKSNWTEDHKLFPYPQAEILINPNLLPQNHGY